MTLSANWVSNWPSMNALAFLLHSLETVKTRMCQDGTNWDLMLKRTIQALLQATGILFQNIVIVMLRRRGVDWVVWYIEPDRVENDTWVQYPVTYAVCSHELFQSLSCYRGGREKKDKSQKIDNSPVLATSHSVTSAMFSSEFNGPVLMKAPDNAHGGLWLI